MPTTRPTQVMVRFTKKEKALIRKKAKALKISMSEFVRDRALAPDAAPLDDALADKMNSTPLTVAPAEKTDLPAPAEVPPMRGIETDKSTVMDAPIGEPTKAIVFGGRGN